MCYIRNVHFLQALITVSIYNIIIILYYYTAYYIHCINIIIYIMAIILPLFFYQDHGKVYVWRYLSQIQNITNNYASASLILYAIHALEVLRDFHALLLRLGTKVASIDNRKLLGMCFVFAFAGSLLVGDWQSIGDDSCNSEYVNTPSSEEELQSDFASSGLDSSAIPIDEQSNSMSDNIITYLAERCEALSNNSSTDQCFWNPQSRITGEFCNTCLDTCLSVQKSLDIYQFSIGLFLLAISTSFAFVLVSAISSDLTSVHSQV